MQIWIHWAGRHEWSRISAWWLPATTLLCRTWRNRTNHRIQQSIKRHNFKQEHKQMHEKDCVQEILRYYLTKTLTERETTSSPSVLNVLNLCLWGKNNPILSCTSDVMLMSEGNSSACQCWDHFKFSASQCVPLSWPFLLTGTKLNANRTLCKDRKNTHAYIHPHACIFTSRNPFLKYPFCRSTIPGTFLWEFCNWCPNKCIGQLCSRDRMCWWFCSSRARIERKM